MSDTPLVSIIIPTFNRAHLISETLDSILKQSYSNWECIVVDDGSNDTTDVVMERYCLEDKRFHYHKRPENKLKGANACRNHGFEKSKGEFVQWFDSDDILHYKKIESQLVDLMQTKKKISLTNFTMFKGSLENIDPLNARLQDDGKSTFLSFIAGKSLLNMQIALFDRSIVENMMFDETLYQSQDLDFMYRLLKESYDEVSILDKVLCHIRKHTDTITNRFRSGDVNELNSEIRIRERIFLEMYKTVPDGIIKNGLLHRTLYAYRALLVHGYIKNYLKKMKLISKHIGFIKKLKLMFLVGLGLFYRITRIGLYTYGKFLRTI